MEKVDYRAFAKKYIKERLTENRVDAIEELSGYLADWLRIRDQCKKLRLGLPGLTTSKDPRGRGH